MSDMEPMIINAPVKVDLLKISGEDGKPLVSIGPDGTVTVHELGAEPKAAKIFWDAIHIQGVSLFNKIAQLEEKNQKMVEAIKLMKWQIEQENFKIVRS